MYKFIRYDIFHAKGEIMEWKLALEILIPLFTLMGWIFHRINKKFEFILDELIDKKFEFILDELKDIRRDLRMIEVRLAKIEGRMESFHWNPEIKEK